MGKSKMSNNDDLLASFDASVRRGFDFLIIRFGFRHVGSSMHAPECSTVYENSTTRITVAFELGSGPWVELERKVSSFLNIGRRERYDLAFLLMERVPDETRTDNITDLDDPELPKVLEGLGRQLEEYGSDVLRGDFSVFPRLRKRAEENLKRRSE